MRTLRRGVFPRGVARRDVAVFLAASIGLLGASDARSQAIAPTAEQVEAAYLHKFTGYVEWPPRAHVSPTSPLVVGVVGSERMFELLSAIVPGRPVQDRVVEVRRIEKPEQIIGVHLVFVGKEAWKDLAAWTSAATDKAMVVTTDAPLGVDGGAVLAFVEKDQRVRFQISLPAAELAGVKLSSRLLSVADKVVVAPP